MKDSAHTNDVQEHLLATAQRIMSSKGFSGVGLKEILDTAKVPKGSFYHYFESKEAFGKALLERYFEGYLAGMDAIVVQPGLSGAERLDTYWQHWLQTQAADDPQSKCLVVKLAAEVSDLSEAMRDVLLDGTRQITERLARMIEQGRADGSIAADGAPLEIASQHYQAWLGASLMAKITKNDAPLQAAMQMTRKWLG